MDWINPPSMAVGWMSDPCKHSLLTCSDLWPFGELCLKCQITKLRWSPAITTSLIIRQSCNMFLDLGTISPTRKYALNAVTIMARNIIHLLCKFIATVRACPRRVRMGNVKGRWTSVADPRFGVPSDNFTTITFAIESGKLSILWKSEIAETVDYYCRSRASTNGLMHLN